MNDIIKQAFIDELSKIADHDLDKRKIKKNLPGYLGAGALAFSAPAGMIGSIADLKRSHKIGKWSPKYGLPLSAIGALLGIPYGVYKYRRDV